jgi:Homeodomain-like domain
MVYRVRKQLVEEGFEAVLSRKPRAAPSVPRIFDGEKEAKLIALACSEPPKGRARWTLRLLENKVVELNIVDRASDSTIGRLQKAVRGAAPSEIENWPQWWRAVKRVELLQAGDADGLGAAHRMTWKTELIAVHAISVPGAESGIIYLSRLSRKYQNIMRAREKY